MMSAIRFLKETQRMCNSYQECTDCPLKELASFSGQPTCKSAMLNECEKAIFAVDVWSRTHPLVTNEMKLREVFGDNAANSILALHPSDIKRWLAEPYKERES